MSKAQTKKAKLNRRAPPTIEAFLWASIDWETRDVTMFSDEGCAGFMGVKAIS